MSFPKFSSTILDNNIKLLLVPIKNVQTVAVSVTINAGYFEEKKDEIGIAHFLEHMIARYLRDGPAMEKIRKKGIVVSTNAYTSPFRTSYYAYGNSTYSNDILKLILDTYSYREIDTELFSKEKTAVIVEMKKKMIKKDIVGQIKDLPIMMFGKSTKIQSDPQRHIDVVSKSKEKDLIEFMKKNYLSGRTTITITGKFNKQQVLKIINNLVLKIKKTPDLKKRQITQYKEGVFPKIKVIPEQNRKVTKIILTFLVFNSYQYSKKYKAILLKTILSRIGDKSILFDRLRSKLGVTYSPKADIDCYPYFGEFGISLDVEPKNIEKTLIELSKIIKELKNNILDKQLVKLAKSRLQLDIKNSLYDINPTNYLKYTDKFIDNEEIINPLQVYNKYYKNLTENDVKEISKTMFKKNKCYLLLVGQCNLKTQKIRSLIDKF